MTHYRRGGKGLLRCWIEAASDNNRTGGPESNQVRLQQEDRRLQKECYSVKIYPTDYLICWPFKEGF